MARDTYSFGITNLEHTCRECSEKATTHYSSANNMNNSGYYCSKHTNDLPMYKEQTK